MYVAKSWEEEGVEVAEPYRRRIKVLLAPDRGGVEALSLSLATIPPGSRTDYHAHDRPEAIFVVEGEGLLLHEDEKMAVVSGMVFWVPPGEHHQFLNPGYKPLTLLTIFVPPYSAEENYKRCLAGWEA